MKTWYSCKVKYNKEQENGMLKQITEAYMLDALTYTEAETRIYEAMERDVHGEFTVTQITKTNISELVINEDKPADYWWKVKVVYTTVDGDSEKEVNINNYFMVSADNIGDCIENTNEFLKSMLVPYSIPSVTLTKIVEVYPYDPNAIPANLKPLSEVEAEQEG
ncbi:DUF4494 domain-containing protein [Marinoscillum sp. MHG1-6]|uniref:DUF4494 domain-containing protein n=1 Tax=Marinoscillum sp. MHG1-6 TaxID=2959627 RepID=UPI0021573807|nr:DUF4494 domain-containing protein [Marinoscillum sp. MHG1-6]